MEEEFSEVIDSSDGMFFVLFYKTDGFENFEGLCASLDAFSKIDVKKVIVNCAILPNICKQEAIIRLPSLQSYNNKKVYKEYKGQFTGSSIHDWIKTLQKPIITKLTEDAVPYYRNGNVPGNDNNHLKFSCVEIMSN
uniref:Thioredoxin domain-containing protein n=1 Tax=Heterorhabditis bacteriophora TaxID=37862 RepID=A0A1I7XTS3_HETBA